MIESVVTVVALEKRLIVALEETELLFEWKEEKVVVVMVTEPEVQRKAKERAVEVAFAAFLSRV
jgi:hypothetical protein